MPWLVAAVKGWAKGLGGGCGRSGGWQGFASMSGWRRRGRLGGAFRRVPGWQMEPCGIARLVKRNRQGDASISSPDGGFAILLGAMDSVRFTGVPGRASRRGAGDWLGEMQIRGHIHTGMVWFAAASPGLRLFERGEGIWCSKIFLNFSQVHIFLNLLLELQRGIAGDDRWRRLPWQS